FFSIIEQKRRFPIGKRRHTARCRKNYSADSSSEDSAAEAASAAAISAAALASFSSLAFARFAVTASTDGPLLASDNAALNRSSLEGFSSATFKVPSAPGRPLAFCQSPVIFSSARTGSVGCAPTPIQY